MWILYNCGIYQIKNLVNKKCYVGQAVRLHKREIDHFSQLRSDRHENQHLQRAWNKYGKENFKFEILIYCEPFELTRYEQFFSDYYKKLDLPYNIRNCVDSNKGLPCSDETKRKISEKQKGEKAYNYKKIFSKETRDKISKELKGRKRTEEHIKNLLTSLNGSSGMFGKQHREDTKKKMSEARKLYWQKRRKERA